MTNTETDRRPLYMIAHDIMDHWPNPYFGAQPYLHAMFRLDGIDDVYGSDSADTIVAYFLTNTKTWRGADARRIKAELRAMVK